MEIKSNKNSQFILDEILNSGKVHDALGQEYTLNSNIDRAEGTFLQKLINDNSFTKTIEVGCAYGISSLFICGATLGKDSWHTIIDPFQSTDWNNIGIAQLEKAGIKNFDLIEKKSEIALPELLARGEKFDFAFIDGWHTFDHTLLDMFYLNKMLKVGGIMVIDDVGMKGIEKAVNYFLKYPAYNFVDGIKLDIPANRKRFNNFLVTPLRAVAKIAPSRLREEIFSDAVASNAITGYSMVALKKICDDVRPWNWYANF